MKKYPSTTLIITTYNWPDALELILLSVIKQSLFPDKVIIADDGSGEETKRLIDKFRCDFPVPIEHVWHEDTGFRLAEIRNKAINKADTDYIIQIDGDIILHKHFIKSHLQMARSGVFISGSRVWLSESLSEKIQKNKKVSINYFTKEISNRLNSIHNSFLMYLFSFYNKNIMKVRGCNMSFWKKDLIAINGYNEDMTGWGREDSEICARLINSKKLKKHIKFGAVQYHLYHKLSTRTELNRNHDILTKTISQKLTRCVNGLNNC